jgi:predicted transcriptional regulator
LEKAVQLRNHSRDIFLELYRIGKPATAQEVAAKIKFERAYVHMRLLGLEEKGLIRSFRKGRKKLFEVIV